jgi:hypothetical protein
MDTKNNQNNNSISKIYLFENILKINALLSVIGLINNIVFTKVCLIGIQILSLYRSYGWP